MRPLKIGILTFHRCINYGSYWQTRCLVEGLRERGHDAVVLDHQSGRVNIAEWKCALQPVLPCQVPKSDYPLYRKKIQGFFGAFESLPLSNPFSLDEPSDMEYYDLVVVGSDEVWNLSHPWFGNCPLFYGDGIRSPRLISYAASFGNYDSSNGLDNLWAEKLRNFEKISVRDENSKNIIKNALGFQPKMVLDPCLQFPLNEERGTLAHITKPYVAVYGHNFSEYYARQIRHWAENKGITLVSIGYRNDWADEQWLTADPFEFASFIRNSEAVATNFFHGCIFALANLKPFACEKTPYRSNKLEGLMSKIGGEKHLLEEGTPAAVYKQRMTEPLDPCIIEKICDLRIISNAFLDQALASEQFLSYEVSD